MNGYNLTRNWYSHKFENPDKVKHVHSDLYFYIVDLWNRLGQKDKFGLPTDVTMESVGIKSYNTYSKALKDLIEFGFVVLVADSKNQHSSKIIALSKNDKAIDKAIDKAHIKAMDNSIDKSVDTIDKQLNKETTKQRNKETIIVVTDQKTNFKKWNLEDFQNSIKTENETNLERSDLIDFYDYWIEPTPSGMFRFQTHKTWSTKLRLKTWSRNKREINPKPKNQEDGLKSAVFGALTKLNGLN